MDEEFLDQIMGAETGVGKVDNFIGQLWTGWKQLRDEGLVQVRTHLFFKNSKFPILIFYRIEDASSWLVSF